MEKREELKWFYLSIFLSLIIAALGYSIQFYLLKSNFDQISSFGNLFFRFIRMSIGYVVIPLMFFSISKNNPLKYGFQIVSRKYLIYSLILGVVLYLVPSYIFSVNNIFTNQWKYRSWLQVVTYLVLIGGMASITDYWTRGFLLLKLEEYYGKIIAITGQNIVWFVLHIYEILLLVPHIGLFPSIILTLFLGIAGDMIILHYRNITGLMIGHVILNVFIALTGKGIISF